MKNRTEKILSVRKKKADKSRHKIIIPKYFIEKFGFDYVMYCYEDRMVIIPFKEEK